MRLSSRTLGGYANSFLPHVFGGPQVILAKLQPYRSFPLCIIQVLQTMLFGVKPTDPLTFAAVSILLTVAALLATYIPARRAAKVDPMTALRYG